VLQAGLWAGVLSACGGTVGTVLHVVPSQNTDHLRAAGLTTKARAPRAATPAPTHPPDVPATEVVHAPRDVNRVALTFQGYGDARMARALLHEAERAHVRITVLAVGSWLEAHPFMAHRILHGGHELGNHTFSHPQMLRLSAEDAYEEIRRCAGVLRKLTGSPGAWFRPTGTPHANPTILSAAGRAGYARVLSYDVATYDVTDPTPTQLVTNTDASIQPGSVVSLHLGHRATVTALPEILDHLKAKNLLAVTASELFGPIA
jgi:peptidoglycan/xylan/chitin deacetylase (PgdA/CDA1 family)